MHWNDFSSLLFFYLGRKEELKTKIFKVYIHFFEIYSCNYFDKGNIVLYSLRFFTNSLRSVWLLTR